MNFGTDAKNFETDDLTLFAQFIVLDQSHLSDLTAKDVIGSVVCDTLFIPAALAISSTGE